MVAVRLAVINFYIVTLWASNMSDLTNGIDETQQNMFYI